MVEDIVHVDVDSLLPRLGDQLPEIGLGAELGIDAVIVQHVVAVV